MRYTVTVETTIVRTVTVEVESERGTNGATSEAITAVSMDPTLFDTAEVDVTAPTVSTVIPLTND